MSEPTPPRGGFKWLSIVWALLLGVGIITLAGSILLPSTKRARVDWDEVRHMNAEDQAALTTAPTTEPAK